MFIEGVAISGNRRWGTQLGWLPVASDICTQILNAPPSDGMSAEFAWAVYEWQDDQVRLGADGVIGPRTWHRMRRRLRNTAVPNYAPPDVGARACLNAFVFHPIHNAPNKPADATGMFIPQARNFTSLHEAAAPIGFDNSQRPGVRRRETFEALSNAPGGSTRSRISATACPTGRPRPASEWPICPSLPV